MFLNIGKRFFVFLLFFSGLSLSFNSVSSSSKWQVVNLVAKNELNEPRKNASVCIESAKYSFNASRALVVVGDEQLVHQLVSCEGQGEKTGLLILTDFEPNQEKLISIYTRDTATAAKPNILRTQSELAVRVGGVANEKGVYKEGAYVSLDSYILPTDHKVGNKLFKYEGIGLESDKMAYRYYFDHRGSMDVFGKKIPDLVLQNVGLDSGDYHKLEAWGMDVLKVGPAFGIGTLAHWQGGQINKMSEFSQLSTSLYSGANQSGFRLNFSDWKTPEQTVDAVIDYSIRYGDAKVKVESSTSKPLTDLATGIVNHKLDAVTFYDKNSEWGYVASYGKQSLAGDNLGLAVLFRSSNFKAFNTDEINHSVVLSPQNSQLTYYFLADWQSGIDGSKNKHAFLKRLKDEIALLNSPIKLTKLQ